MRTSLIIPTRNASSHLARLLPALQMQTLQPDETLVVDSAFQMMILWSFEQFGAGSLPSFAGRYRQFHETFPRDGAQVVIRVTSQQSHSAVADVEFLERANGKLIARLEGYECVIDASLQQAFQRNQLPQAGRPAALVAACCRITAAQLP